MKASPKDEAIQALDMVLADLDEDQLTGLIKAQMKASLAYAKEQIGLIQELKRPRKRAKEA